MIHVWNRFWILPDGPLDPLDRYKDQINILVIISQLSTDLP